MGSNVLWQVEENRTRIYDMRFTIDEAAGLSNRKSEIVHQQYGGAVAQLVER